MNDNKHEIIETTAPIPLDTLKLYFENKNVFYIIDYDNSTLTGDKFLTYLSNLEIPCDIKIVSEDKFHELYSCYLKFNQIVNIPLLETTTINLLFDMREITNRGFDQYIERYKTELFKWEDILESLLLYNFYTMESDTMKEYIKNTYKHDDTDSLEGINFVSLLKHPVFYEFYRVYRTEQKYYSKYFNEYMFKGNNLYYYWAAPHNLFHLNLKLVCSGEITGKEMANIVNDASLEISDLIKKVQTNLTQQLNTKTEEFKNVTLV